MKRSILEKEISLIPSPFLRKCYELVLSVPAGCVTTYKDLANALHTKAYRAVGQAMRKNPFAPFVPCHRVIKSNGSIGEYAFGKAKKIALLREEGICIYNGKVQDFDRLRFKPVVTH